MAFAAATWQPSPEMRERVDALIRTYRKVTIKTLEPLVHAHYPALPDNPNNEYRKMIELSTKMVLVGDACTEIGGYRYDARRQRIGSLFGCCCFLADSFIDDFGQQATREYIDRLDRLLTEGWFEVRNEREQLFYVIIRRLFAERNVLVPTLRQAIIRLFEAQRRDVELRFDNSALENLPRRRLLAVLKDYARDRSGHAIIVLAAFLVPQMSLNYRTHIFAAGALIMHIDDHGDCYADLSENRITFMNQVKHRERALYRVFVSSIERVFGGLPDGPGRDLLIAFLTRYYLTRVEKHRQERSRGAASWAVYE